jgi:hypothetical protein
MSQQTGDPRKAWENRPSLDERIAGLRRRRSALTHLIDSLTLTRRPGNCLEKETPTDAVEP